MSRSTPVNEDTIYAKTAYQELRVRGFVRWAKQHSDLKLYFPNYDAAPWHVMTLYKGEHYDVHINFWPHKNKAQTEGHQVHQGINAYDLAYLEAIKYGNEDVEVINDDQSW